MWLYIAGLLLGCLVVWLLAVWQNSFGPIRARVELSCSDCLMYGELAWAQTRSSMLKVSVSDRFFRLPKLFDITVAEAQLLTQRQVCA